ncbi:GNAT family N-acetyltransferase [Devosia sp.]|uniref:GNAT family N-acetyltransferase n=1 Tax=Devosia sp. TaxID=1871048 RepID=UPI003A90BFF9
MDRATWIAAQRRTPDPAMIAGSAPLLHTERLTLGPYALAGYERLCAVYATERSRYVGGPLPPDEVWQNMAGGIGQWPLLGLGTWMITQRDTGAPVGEVAVSWPPRFPEPEIGWVLFDGQEGKGYALEAATAARDWGIRLRKVPTLVSYVDENNLASQRLCERLGGVRDLTAATPNGDPCWVYRYDIGNSAAQPDIAAPSEDVT